jgi:hypothetical protein
MKRVPYSLYLMPARPGSGPKAKPYRSSWRMSPSEAAGAGALYPIAGTTEVREIPETDEEMRRAMVGPQSVGRDGTNQRP